MARQQKGSNHRRGTAGPTTSATRRRDTLLTKSADTAHTVEAPGRNVQQRPASTVPSWRPAGDSWSASSSTRPTKWCSWTRPTLRKPAASAGTPPSQNNRRKAVCACGACGCQANADHNAAINIPVRAQGQPQGLPRPVNRICVVSCPPSHMGPIAIGCCPRPCQWSLRH